MNYGFCRERFQHRGTTVFQVVNERMHSLVRRSLSRFVFRFPQRLLATSGKHGSRGRWGEFTGHGAIIGKKWVAITDNDTRSTHEAVNGVTVQPRDSFLVGESYTPYPGHWSLPAKERVHCRCTTISAFSEALLAAAENPEFDE